MIGSTLASGHRLGPYEIVEKLGEGGMGEVYKARDTRLGRTVAIKVLSSRRPAGADARTRFDREARTISSLSHPHICALFDIGHEGETDYLVMELLEGGTLAQRIAKGALPLADALRIGSEIAEALDKAHRMGIVHRDLKPANVMLTRDGVKLLDFGLAKLHTAPAPSLSRSTVGALPTAVAPAEPLTEDGTLIGTPQYMAPEQVEGRDIDTRTDLWALGCVLYEMATGRKAFSGESSASLIAAILGPGPDSASRHAPSAPPALDRLIRACLAKEREHRWQSALDAAIELEGIAEGRDSARAAPSGERRLPMLAVALAGFAALGLGTLGFWIGTRGKVATQPGEVRFSVSPPPRADFPESVEDDFLAISPDGRSIAFVAIETDRTSRIWMRSVADLDSRALPGTEGAHALTFSPDSRSLAFFADGKLKRLDLAGGAVVTLCNVAPKMGFSASWGTAGQILFASIQGEAIYRVAAAGGSVEKVLAPDASRQEVRTSWPTYLDDGKAFLYIARNSDLRSTLMQAEPGKPARSVANLDSRVERGRGDWLIFVREGALLAQRFDRAAGRLAGAATAIAPAVRYFMSSEWSGFAASPSGAVFYLSQETSHQITWFDRAGKPLGTLGPRGSYLSAVISPDGREVLADRKQGEMGTYDIWRMDVERNVETRVTTSPDADFGPVWTPDGKAMLYSSPRGRSPILLRRDLVSGVDRVLVPKLAFQDTQAVSRDGRLFIFTERGDEGRFHAWLAHLDGDPRPARLFASEAQQGRLRFSPDSAFVAYLSDESGANEAYVSPLATPAQRARLSTRGATALQWSRDGREIFMLTPDNEVFSVPVSTSQTLEVGTPARLFSLAAGTDWANFDISPDAKRFLAVVREHTESAPPGTLILNWTPEGAR